MDCKEIQPVHPNGDQSWVFIGRTDVEAETPILWPPDAKSWLIWKDPDAGKDWGQEKKGTTEDEMAGWHHRLNGLRFGWTPGVGDRQGGLVCCGLWDRKESDTTEQLNWTELPVASVQISKQWIQSKRTGKSKLDLWSEKTDHTEENAKSEGLFLQSHWLRVLIRARQRSLNPLYNVMWIFMFCYSGMNCTIILIIESWLGLLSKAPGKESFWWCFQWRLELGVTLSWLLRFWVIGWPKLSWATVFRRLHSQCWYLSLGVF